MENFINIQLVYALEKEQTVLDLQIKPGITILKVIEESGIAHKHPEIDLDNLCVGVYSKIKPLDYVLQNDDRIEIYRELKVTKKVVKTSKINVEN